MKNLTAKISLAAILVGVLAAATSCGGQAKETLNVYTWEGMFPDEVIASFEKEYNVTVNYVNFDTDETMLSKLQAANGGDYDIIVADDYILETAIEEGLVTALDKSKLSNYGNINPAYMGQYYDPDDVYTVPYGAGVQTIVYNPEVVSVDIKGYADLWDSSLVNQIGVTSNYRVINGMALKVLGYSYNTESADEINAAAEKLYDLAPNIRLIKDDYLQDDLLSGEISVGVMYTSQVTQAMIANPDLKVVYPEEGIGYGIMGMFIPSNAPHSDLAYKFMDYCLDAQNGAKCFEYLGYYCTNSAAEQYISEEYRSFLTIPESVDTEHMEMVENVSEATSDLHANIWNEFCSKCGAN